MRCLVRNTDPFILLSCFIEACKPPVAAANCMLSGLSVCDIMGQKHAVAAKAMHADAVCDATLFAPPYLALTAPMALCCAGPCCIVLLCSSPCYTLLHRAVSCCVMLQLVHWLGRL
jgi:hypothetical protein